MSAATARATARTLHRTTPIPHPDITIFVDPNSGNFKPIPVAYSAPRRPSMSR
jgi:hypothetical protein